MKNSISIFSYIKENLSQTIGYILLFHWVLLLIDRVAAGQIHNLFWFSHVILLLTAIGFIMKNELLLMGALAGIVIVHGFWIYDFILLMVTGVTELNNSAYFLSLDLYRRVLTSHHLYLIPLLTGWLISVRKVNIFGWLIASAAFLFATSASFFFLPKEYNINCVHLACPPTLELLPVFSAIITYSPFLYFLFVNGIMGFGFFVLNMLLYWVFEFSGYLSK